MTWLQAPDWLSRPNQCEWVHIAGTYDGATMALYVDGLYTKCSVTQTGAILIPDLKENKFLMGGYSYAPPDAGAGVGVYMHVCECVCMCACTCLFK